MDTLETRRWYPAFVIYRWRHLLWMLPLLALLGLLVLHWKHLRRDQTMAVLQLCPARISSCWGPVPAGPVFGHAELMAALVSPEVLGESVRDTGLAALWQVSEAEAAGRLRSLITYDLLPGTALVEVKVGATASTNPQAICRAIVEHARAKLTAELAAWDANQLAAAEAEAKTVEAELDLFRKKFGMFAKWHPRTGIGPLHYSPVGLGRFEAGQKRLENLKLQIISMEMNAKILENPVMVHMAAHSPRVILPQRWKALGMAAAWALGVSVLLAIVLAYVLEAMVPRRVDGGSGSVNHE